jgi:hypothetical protein
LTQLLALVSLIVFIDVHQESKREKVLQEQEKKRQALALPNEMREDDQVCACLKSQIYYNLQ